MRHLRSILYALVLAPAVWILCGVGFDQDLTGRARDNGGIESLSGVLLLLLAGAAYAILLFAPISPAGPLLAGLALLGIGAWARLAPESYAGVWPANVAKDGFNLSTPGYGLAVLLAVPLVCTALSARRWAGYEPPQLVLIGTIGRARGAAPVAGTPMGAERTTVIPQQRQAPGFPGVAGFPGPSGFPGASGDTTQVAGPAQPTVTLPVGDDDRTAVVPVERPDDNGDEKATVMQLGRRPAGGGDEPTQIVPPEPATEDLASGEPPTDEPPTEVTGGEPPTEAIADEPATDATVVSAAVDEITTRNVIGDEDTRDVGGDRDVPTPPAGETIEDETTRDVVAAEALAGDETTRLVLPGADEQTRSTGPAPDEGDERTQLLTLPTAGRPPHQAGHGPAQHGETDHGAADHSSADHGERTQVIRLGTVEPPGDRTQLLTFPAPGEATTAATPAVTQTRATGEPADDTTTRSIAAAERPDPGDDPTTRLSMVRDPAPATTRDRRPMSATSLERPPDEAADDTRPLTLPVPRPPVDNA